MQLLQNMDMDTFVVVVPAALVAMYFIITLQKSLSFRNNPYTGLIIPAICVLAATVLAVRPLFILDVDSNLIWFCIRMWAVFNIPTVVLLFPYFKGRQNAKALKAMEAAMAAEAEADTVAEADKNVN